MPWEPDVLGAGFARRTLAVAADAIGEPVATLVRCEADRLLPPAGPAANDSTMLADYDILFVHGWSDYFFHTEVARFFVARGARFFAVDLRRSGRSIRADDPLGVVADLADHGSDLDAALHAMRDEDDGARVRPVIVVAHSTGGLSAALWAADRGTSAQPIAALVLNSPWLALQFPAPLRQAAPAVATIRSHVRPDIPLRLPHFDHYARTLHVDFGGEFDYDPRWKPFAGSPVYAPWLRAVLNGQERLRGGLGLALPILVMSSDRSIIGTRFTEGMRRSDVVLDVATLRAQAPSLGEVVTAVSIPGARHDVFLSDAEARRRVFREMDRWFRGYTP